MYNAKLTYPHFHFFFVRWSQAVPRHNTVCCARADAYLTWQFTVKHHVNIINFASMMCPHWHCISFKILPHFHVKTSASLCNLKYYYYHIYFNFSIYEFYIKCNYITFVNIDCVIVSSSNATFIVSDVRDSCGHGYINR